MTPVTARAAEPADTFMLIYTSGTSGDPKAVICSHGKVAIAGVMMTERFGLGPDDICYVSMPLFHSNAVLVGWAVSLACRGSMVLRRKFSASQFLPDVRRYGATYANYVGKPLSYVLATPERPDDADNPLRAVYGNEGAPADVDRFARRFDTIVVDGFGSTEGGVAIGRTPDTPPGALGPLPDGTEIVDVDTGEPCPPGVTGEIVNTAGAGRFEGYYNDPDADAERMRGGVYHSGDLGYRDENGYAYFAGRLGDWMRVDGENLGAAPIERVLLRHPDVIEVAVYGIPAPDVGDQVMAALLLADGADVRRRRVPRVPRRAARPRPKAVAVVRADRRRAAAHRVVQGDQAPAGGAGHRLRGRGVADSAVTSGGWATANSHRRRTCASSSNARGWWTDRQSRSACFPTAAWTSSGCRAASSSPGRTPPRSSTREAEKRSWACGFGQARCPGCSAFPLRSCATAAFR